MEPPSFALTDAAGQPLEGWELIDGPQDVGSEERWLLRLADGRRAMLCRLAPQFARDQSLRRRWVRDVDKLVKILAQPMVAGPGSVAPILATGPWPDPADEDAEPPWRLRLEPEGEPLTTWLARAPVPIDELAHRGAALADALHAVHRAGAVVRKLHPRDLIWTADQRVILTDVGLARVELLSSHTASSLLVTGSAYTAPEQLLRTVVDQRADLYTLGVILWQAATGTLPFGEGPALLRERVPLPPLPSLRQDAPPVLDLLVRRCLAELPEDRPESAAEVAWVLRGGAGDGLVVAAQTQCQHCGAPLRLGQRLCLACGRVGVRFAHIPVGPQPGWALELRSLSEDSEALANLRRFLAAVVEGPLPLDEFVIGDVTLYSEHELVWRKRLPARLFDRLDRETAEELCARMRELGLDAHTIAPNRGRRWGLSAAGTGFGSLFTGVALGVLGAGGAAFGVIAVGAIATIVMGAKVSSAIAESRTRPLYGLRQQPAALPASDPLVARMAALLEGSSAGPTPADVRAQLAELALLVQRLVDRRAELLGLARPYAPHVPEPAHAAAEQVQAAEFEALTAPVEPLVRELEARVRELTRLDTELAELDEADMVRALAVLDARISDAGKRGLERARLLDGLDRLRGLEDRRTETFHRLLEASTLLRRACELGLAVHNPAAEHERHVALALAALGGAEAT